MITNKKEIYKYLDDNGINYEVTEHKAVFNMDELADVELPYPEADAKNISVRDDKKRHYYLITVKGDKRVDLKGLSIGTVPVDNFRMLITPKKITKDGNVYVKTVETK